MVCLIPFWVLAAVGAINYPNTFFLKTPSIHQINSTFKDGGYTLCGPTAAADVITYLWQNGYQNFQADNQAKTVNE